MSQLPEPDSAPATEPSAKAVAEPSDSPPVAAGPPVQPETGPVVAAPPPVAPPPETPAPTAAVAPPPETPAPPAETPAPPIAVAPPAETPAPPAESPTPPLVAVAPPPEPEAPAPAPAAGPSTGRLILGIVIGAAVAALGGAILGEYPFTGVTPYIAGALFALVVSEVIVSVSRRRDRITAVAAAVCTVGGLGWAVWISVGRGVAPVPIGGWMALLVGLVAALVRGGIATAGRQGPSNPPRP